MNLASRFSSESNALLILLPFAVADSLVMRIMRALRACGENIQCLIQQRDTGPYKRDDLRDFADSGDLIDLSAQDPQVWQAVLDAEIKKRGIAGLLQVGAHDIYPLLGLLKQNNPNLRVGDMLYNQIGHVVRHFMYERAIDRVFVESGYMRGVVEESTSIPMRAIEVLHSGINLDVFVPAPSRLLRPLTLGFIGRFSEEKGALDFVTLAGVLVHAGLDVHFAVFGVGPLEETMRSLCKASPAADRIAFHGYVADVKDAFAAVDMLVVPSRADGRPVSIMEAAASGVPVIGAPVGGIPEMIEEGVNGWIAGPAEVERIAYIVAELQRRPATLEAVRVSARGHAERHFDERQMLEAYKDAFRRLSGQGQSDTANKQVAC